MSESRRDAEREAVALDVLRRLGVTFGSRFPIGRAQVEAFRQKVAATLVDALDAERARSSGSAAQDHEDKPWPAEAIKRMLDAERAREQAHAEVQGKIDEARAAIRSPQDENHEENADDVADRRVSDLRADALGSGPRGGLTQGEDHEGIEAARAAMFDAGFDEATSDDAEAVIAAYLARVSAPERDPDDDWQLTYEKPHPNDPLLRSPERNTVRLVERLRSGLLLIAQDTALSAETHRLMAQDLLTEFPVSGESEDER